MQKTYGCTANQLYITKALPENCNLPTRTCQSKTCVWTFSPPVFPRTKAVFAKLYIQLQVQKIPNACNKPEIQKQRVSGSPYWAPLPCERKRSTRALFKPKWASGEILVHVIHAKQMKLNCTDIFLICACHPECE